MVFNLIINTEVYMPLLCILIYLPLLKSNNPGTLAALLYCVINFTLMLCANILAKLDTNNLVLYHLLTLIDVLFACFYILKLALLKKFVLIYTLCASAFTIFWVMDIYFFEASNQFNRLSATVGCIFILVLSAHHMACLAKGIQIIYFYKLVSFWIISGFLFGSLLNIVLLLIGLAARDQLLFFIDQDIAVVVKFSFFSLGFLGCYKKIPFAKISAADN